MPGRLGHKTPGSANRSWSGNLEPVDLGAFTERQNTHTSSHHCTHTKLTLRHGQARTRSRGSHRCSPSQLHITLPHCSHMIHTHQHSCSAHSHIDTLRHTHVHTGTLKPRTHSQAHNKPQRQVVVPCTPLKTQVVVQFTHSHTLRYMPTCTHLHTQRHRKLHVGRLRALLYISQPSFLC